MKRILALIVCLLSAQMMIAQTTELQAKRVRALDSVFINGRWIKSVGTDTSLTGTNRDLPSIEAVRLHIANRMNGIAALYATKTQLQDSIGAIRLLIGNGGSLDWTAGFPVYDARYPSITRFLDTSANIWSRVQSTYQVAQANYSTTFALLNDGRDSIQNRYTKAQSDARYLQSFTETDPTVYAWAKAATKPAYAVAEITGLQTALDGKQNVLGFTPVPDTRTINGAPLSANITLTKTDIGLSNVPNTDATNPANITQSSSFRFVTDTEKSTWNAKQNALGYTPENVANKGVANGYAALGSDSKILAYQLPQVAINQTFTVNSQSAMLALSANQGDIAVRTDQNKAYILAFTGASTLANWIALPGVSNEADPVFTASPAFGVTGTNISNWNSAFGWGNHAGLYRPVSWVPSWTDVTGRPTALSQFTNDAGFITGINSSMVTTALGFTPFSSSGGTLSGHLNMGGWNISGVTTISATQAAISGVIDAFGATFQRPIYVNTGNGGYAVSIGGSGGDYGSIGYNVTYTGTTNSYNYRVGDFASFIRFWGGGFQFFTAPSGTTGASMSPVNRYTMDVNGNNSWSGNGIFGGSLQINSRNFLYLGNTANTLYPSIRNMDTDGIGIYTNAGSALLEASAASGVSTNGRAFSAGSASVSGLTVGSAGAATIAAGANNLLVQTSSYTQLFRRDNAVGIYLGGASDQSNYYDNNGHVFRSASGGTEWLAINSGGITTSRAYSGTSASLSGRMNADDYEMGAWRILDWAGVTAQIGGINGSQWQQIDFYTNGTMRGSFTNTEFVSNLPASISGGTAMTGGWNRTVQLTANFPSIVFNSSSQKWAGISFDYSSNFVIRMNATSSDVFGSGYSALLINNSTGAATFNNTVSATRFFATSDIRLKNVFSEFKSADGINTILYSFKNEFKPAWGYNAQQVQKEMSFAVTQGDDGYLRVDYQQVHTYKIMQLEKRIAELERRVNNGLPEEFPFVDGDSKKVLLKNDHQ